MDNQPLEKPKRVNLDNFILLNDMTDEQLDKQHKIEMKRMMLPKRALLLKAPLSSIM